MLVAVVVVFVICWAPLLIEHVLTSYGVIAKNEERTGDKVWLKYMSIGFHLLSYFNSCVNPIVYGFMSRSFRESFRQALCRCCRSGRRPGRQPSTNTRTTSLRLNDTRWLQCRGEVGVRSVGLLMAARLGCSRAPLGALEESSRVPDRLHVHGRQPPLPLRRRLRAP
ncbi:Elevenin Receptor [Frankliniella occidentalis]|nr:Elevenin Receptor [Frankliniella occidentalis]